MNRVICDVCGTKYPESSEQCPICGCAKPENAKVVSGESGLTDNDPAGSYTHVKGGRFSKSNVRRRNRAAADSRGAEVDLDNDDTPKEKDSNKGLVIAVVALLLAIVAVMLFIFFRYFSPAEKTDNSKATTVAIETTTVPSTTETEATQTISFLCTGIELSAKTIYFDQIGDTWLLSVDIIPAECTDKLTFVSSDPAVVVITDDGRVTSLAPGEAEITVTCGDISEVCSVTVVDSSATTEATIETTVPVENANWELNRKDISFTKAGESWVLYKGDVDKDDIVWSSDNSAVATFDKGVVTAVGPGITNVHAEYNGTKYSCIIRCRFEAASTDTTDPAETTEPTQTTDPVKYTLHINGVSVSDSPWGADVTLKVNESFQLTLRTENNDIINVTWTASKEGICSIDGNKITGKSKGITEIVVNYAGETYKCSVTVKGK